MALNKRKLDSGPKVPSAPAFLNLSNCICLVSFQFISISTVYISKIIFAHKAVT